MIKKPILFTLKLIGVVYNFFICKVFWITSDLVKHNKTNALINCPICQSSNVQSSAKALIKRSYGLFDKRTFARNVYNTNFLPDGKLKKLINEQQKYVSWPKQFFVNYYKCKKCIIYYQNTPLNGYERDEYYSTFYRSSKVFGRPHLYYPKSKFHLWGDYIQRSINLKKNSKVLDVGCAEGHQVLRFKELGYDAYGIEPSKSMVSYAQKKLKLSNVKSGSYTSESYKDEFFDCITSYHVIEHVTDHIDLILSMKKHLKKNGYLIISTPSGNAASDYYISNKKNKDDLNNVFGGGHALLFSYQYIEKILTKLDFKIIKSQIIKNKNQLIDGKRISDSGEKWMGMNFFAIKN